MDVVDEDHGGTTTPQRRVIGHAVGHVDDDVRSGPVTHVTQRCPQVVRETRAVRFHLVPVLSRRARHDQLHIVAPARQSLSNSIDVLLRAAGERMGYVSPALDENSQSQERPELTRYIKMRCSRPNDQAERPVESGG